MIKNREQWLKERLTGIGGSEASAVLGLNPYMSNVDLWNIKMGNVIPEDIGDKPYVKYGIEAEPYLRALFALDFPQYEVIYKDFDLIRHKKYPFIYATLDGRLIEKGTGRKGVLEIKTTEILRSMRKESWKDKIPDNYYIQVLHQLLATDFDFAVVKAQLKRDFGEGPRLETIHFHIERTDKLEDVAYLEEKEIEFWAGNVITGEKPNLILPTI